MNPFSAVVASIIVFPLEFIRNRAIKQGSPQQPINKPTIFLAISLPIFLILLTCYILTVARIILEGALTIYF